MQKLVIALVAGLIVSPALADEQVIKLKQGPGLEKVEANCSACHTLAYIPMNSPILNAAGWDAAVNKMINALKAPIDAEDAKAIKEYLAKNYGS